MDNLFVAASNLAALPSIVNNFNNGQYLIATSILLAMLSSIVYHLIEHRKHNMTGIGSVMIRNKWYPEVGRWLNSEKAHTLFINLDRLGVLMVVLSHFWKMVIMESGPHGYMVVLDRLMLCCRYEVPSAFIFLFASESFHYMESAWISICGRNTMKNLFIVTHSLWHCLAFSILYHLSL